jgi:hypothetical protein
MTLPRTVSDVVVDHVVFEVECIDRMYVNVYVPGLQYAAGIVGYVHHQLGLPVASTAPLAKITDAFGAAMHRFAVDQRVPWVEFVKGQRKDEVMHEHLAGFVAGRSHRGGAVHRPRAGEDDAVSHRETPRRGGPGLSMDRQGNRAGQPLLRVRRRRRVRPVLPQVLLLLSLQRQVVPERARDDVAAVQAICDSLGPAEIDALLRKWLARLPHPFTAADRAAGYRYDISILQAEFSLTQMLDKPVSGRTFFE